MKLCSYYMAIDLLMIKCSSQFYATGFNKPCIVSFTWISLFEQKYGARVEEAVNAEIGEFPWTARVGRVERRGYM